jgi:transposase
MARARRPRGFADRGRHRQPVGEDVGKGGPKGYDGAKKVKGRKRHIVTDTLGLLLAVCVHPANIQDRDAGFDVVASAKKKHMSLETLFVDTAYEGTCARRIYTELGLNVEIVRRSDDRAHGVWQGPGLPTHVATRGFQVLPKRWVVERTFAWNDRPRRMAKDFDQRLDVAEAWIWFAQARMLTRRLADPDRPP